METRKRKLLERPMFDSVIKSADMEKRKSGLVIWWGRPGHFF